MAFSEAELAIPYGAPKSSLEFYADSE